MSQIEPKTRDLRVPAPEESEATTLRSLNIPDSLDLVAEPTLHEQPAMTTPEDEPSAHHSPTRKLSVPQKPENNRPTRKLNAPQKPRKKELPKQHTGGAVHDLPTRDQAVPIVAQASTHPLQPDTNAAQLLGNQRPNHILPTNKAASPLSDSAGLSLPNPSLGKTLSTSKPTFKNEAVTIKEVQLTDPTAIEPPQPTASDKSNDPAIARKSHLPLLLFRLFLLLAAAVFIRLVFF